MYFCVLVILTLVNASLSQKSDSCDCVPFYQCGKDGIINIYGGGLLDKRVVEPCTSCNCTDVVEVCCRIPIVPENFSKKPATTCGFRNPDGVGFKSETEPTEGEALLGEFPWMITIYHNGSYRCGGSLIHPSVVLTAAHCVKNPGTYAAKAGNWDRTQDSFLAQPQNRTVSSIKIHEKFNSKNYQNDIALLFLGESFHTADHISPICLVPQGVTVDKRCIATGWGNKKFGPDQNGTAILKKVELPMVKRNACQENLRQTRLGEYFILDDSFVCAGGEKGSDTCTGDGGGPLFCPVDGQEDRYQQVGIVAWGIDCNDDKVPGVYANVANLRQWIDDQMTERKFQPKYYTV